MLILERLLHIDNLSLVMMVLVGFVAVCITSFSLRYLKGDRKQSSFYFNLSALVLAVFIMVSADHIVLFLTSWVAGNLFLTKLMMHKQEWEAAKQSSILALKNFGWGGVFLGSASLILYSVTEETSIQAILSTSIETPWAVGVCLLLMLAAMSQSALWPFHRWLISSLNSPTPVSAIMHAGLVNGGGFLLARFAPILLEQSAILGITFMVGIATALLGTLWKLMQSDIKRTLACSTMGQMGFMIAQCGLGLFPAAVAHLCWHGLFKAYLFLASGSVAQEKRLDLEGPPSMKRFFVAFLCGIVGAYMFSLTSDKDFLAGDTTLFLIVIAMIAGTQVALSILPDPPLTRIPLALIATMITGSLYGLSVRLIGQVLDPLGISIPQPINLLHIIALVALSSSWLAILFAPRPNGVECPEWMLKAYVRTLNASQPHPKTITAHRNQYQF